MERYSERAHPEDRHPEEMQQRRMDYQSSPSRPIPDYNGQYAYRYEDPRRSSDNRHWYNQGWLWLIVAAIALVVIWLAFSGLTQQTAKINDSLQQQNGIMQQQNHILASIKSSLSGISQSLSGLTQAVHDGFDRIVSAIRDAGGKAG